MSDLWAPEPEETYDDDASDVQLTHDSSLQQIRRGRGRPRGSHGRGR